MEKIRLEECCEILDSKRVPITAKDRKSGRYPYYGANGIQDYVDDYIFDDELVLLAEDGGNFGSKERPIAYRVSGKCWVNNHAHVLKAKQMLDIDYLCYSLMFYDVGGMVNGATRQKLTQSQMRQMLIPKRSLEEQKEIVKKLARLTRIKDKRKEQLNLLDNLIKSRFVEMFGDPTTNPKGWIKKKLSDECDIVTGNTPSRQVSEYYGDYIEWIKSDNINTPSATITKATEYLSEAGLSVARSVEAGSILMTCIAGSIKCIGNVAITDRKVSFNQQINGIVPKKNNTWFIYEQFELSKPYIQSTINMSLKGILSKGQLSEIEFVFPPTDLQNEFGVFVQQVDKLKAEVLKSLDETEILFNSLMQKYFE